MSDDLVVPGFVREAVARATPGAWVAVADPSWRGEGPPPEWALLGHWLSGPDGTVTEFRENPAHRPSPLSLDWPAPLEEVDAAVQSAATGYGPPEDVHRALVDAGRLAVALDPDGRVDVVRTAPDEPPVVLVFSSDAQLAAAGDPPYGVLTPAELVALLPAGHQLLLNPGGVVAMRLDPHDLRPAPAGPDERRPPAR
ncbi:type VII secretion system-associated protein [Streptomyces sp. NPDC094032]|uniref:type VII secretion system-associated protein n=1 Tax=Streptomyces sp. NPDC094032 TaxID=3155308 RepID=UPI0033348D20